MFAELIEELARRGQGRRESGAFLLADRSHAPDTLPLPVTAIAYYDDLDAACLTGGITFHARGYTALNARCRRDGLRVVADIHTHPSHQIRQSQVDAQHPMICLDGHVALVAPRYAIGVTSSCELGVHVRTQDDWFAYYGDQAATVVQIGDNRAARASAPWWRRLLSLATGWLRPQRHR